MENKIKVIAGTACMMFGAVVLAKSPVIMTVNGVDVPKSEFEYLYNKNSQQQLTQQPIEEYVEMFKLYKRKVADAKAEGIDTTASFRKEMNQYKSDLALPYLTDTVYNHKLLKEAYDRSKLEVEANHIMFFKTPDPYENKKLKTRLDSIRTAIKNGASFEEMAKKYSQDRGSSDKGGAMGYIRAMQYPYEFEMAVFSTPEGEISDIVDSGVGYHLIKGGKSIKARGKVKAAHILKLTQNLSEEEKAKAKEQIDSIYNIVVANPGEFEILAKQFSDDQGSATQGGMLPVFEPGQMVQPFDSISFAMEANTISSPFETPFGWHIIKKYESLPIASMEEMRPSFLQRIANPQDKRYELVKRNQSEKLASKLKGKLNDKTIKSLNNLLNENGMDSTFFAKVNNSGIAKQELFKIGKDVTTVSALLPRIENNIEPDSDNAMKYLENQIQDLYNTELKIAEENRLYNEVADYRNLLNEYVDGSLLYEVSVMKVWDKAARDTEGLEKFFETNKENYKWSVPHAKGYLIQAANDSVADEVRKRASQLGADTLVNTIRKEFKGVATLDKILVEKGANPMVDNILFDGPQVQPTKKGFTTYFMINPRVITIPETYKDVKGLVTNDYQNEFQYNWEEELKKKYPVTVNEKVLKSIKQK